MRQGQDPGGSQHLWGQQQGVPSCSGLEVPRNIPEFPKGAELGQPPSTARAGDGASPLCSGGRGGEDAVTSSEDSTGGWHHHHQHHEASGNSSGRASPPRQHPNTGTESVGWAAGTAVPPRWAPRGHAWGGCGCHEGAEHCQRLSIPCCCGERLPPRSQQRLQRPWPGLCHPCRERQRCRQRAPAPAAGSSWPRPRWWHRWLLVAPGTGGL